MAVCACRLAVSLHLLRRRAAEWRNRWQGVIQQAITWPNDAPPLRGVQWRQYVSSGLTLATNRQSAYWLALTAAAQPSSTLNAFHAAHTFFCCRFFNANVKSVFILNSETALRIHIIAINGYNFVRKKFHSCKLCRDLIAIPILETLLTLWSRWPCEPTWPWWPLSTVTSEVPRESVAMYISLISAIGVFIIVIIIITVVLHRKKRSRGTKTDVSHDVDVTFAVAMSIN